MEIHIFQRVYSRTIRIVAGICTTTIFGFHTLPHVFPQRTMLATNQVPCSAFDVSEKHQKLLQETCARMNIDENRVEMFYTSGFSTHSAGCLYFPNKAIIGLPRNSMYKSYDDVKNAGINFNEKKIDWESNVGKAFLDVMIFDDENLKFLLGHELTHIQDLDFTVSTAHATGCFYGFYKAGVYFPSLLKGRHFGTIVLMNAFIWLLGVRFYIVTKELLSHRSEYKSDKKSARLGLDYCKGAIDYMRKRLKLNRILRKMHGDGGEILFSRIGNNLQDGNSHPKRTDRLKKLKEIMQQQFENTDSSLAP